MDKDGDVDNYNAPLAPVLDIDEPEVITARTVDTTSVVVKTVVKMDDYTAPVKIVNDNYSAAKAHACDVCETVYETQCSMNHNSRCSTKYEDKCETKYEDKCVTEYDQKCDTKYDTMCDTKYETEFKIVCMNTVRTVTETKCETKCKPKIKSK